MKHNIQAEECELGSWCPVEGADRAIFRTGMVAAMLWAVARLPSVARTCLLLHYEVLHFATHFASTLGMLGV